MISKEFRVKCESLNLHEKLYLVGDVRELGCWNPDAAIALESSGDEHTYRCVVTIASAEFCEYRYFVGGYLDSHPSGAESSDSRRVVVSWEAGRKPRLCSEDDEPSDVYGVGDGIYIDDGWLTVQSEMRLRIFGNAIQLWKSRYAGLVPRLKIHAIDVRFKSFESGDTYEEHEEIRILSRRCRLPLSPFSVTHSETLNGHGGDTDEEHDEMSRDVPLTPSHTETLIAALNAKESGYHFATQRDVGESVSPGRYLVYKTQTVALKYLAFKIEVSVSAGSGSEPQLIGMSYILPSNLRETHGTCNSPITSLSHKPIGSCAVDYMIIRPLSPERHISNCEVSFSRHWKRRATLNVGHRGMGNSYTRMAVVRENTVASLASAGSHGADYVEFDVQLSKDRIPVIYHDFHVCIRPQLKFSGLVTHELHEVPVKNLMLSQLQSLKVAHVTEKSENGTVANGGDAYQFDDHESHQPFPTLEGVLTQIDHNLGFNVEVKYPMMQKDGEWECEHFTERNTYIDEILGCLLNNAGDRRIVFSSFEPDICLMIKMKQNKYPVLFLTQGNTTRYNPFYDDLANESEMAVHFAVSNQLLGVNFHSEDLLRDEAPLHRAQEMGLVSFVWGEDLASSDIRKKFKDMGVDGVIYDRISDDHQVTKNVFLIEKEVKYAASSNGSDRSSPPGDV